jgi:hypothetical protein
MTAKKPSLELIAGAHASSTQLSWCTRKSDMIWSRDCKKWAELRKRTPALFAQNQHLL